MSALEKILEEMKRIKDGNRKEKLYAKYPPNSKEQEVLNAYSQGYEDGTDNFYNATKEIIRKHMSGTDNHVATNDSWIPVEERLPEEGQEVLCCDDKEVYFVEYQADCDAPFGYMDGIIAWQPQPEPYKPEGVHMRRKIERRYNPEYCEQCGYILPQCKCGKDDASKPIFSRVPPEIIRAIEKVREYGCQKYPEDSWKTVELQRYWEATLRHALEAWNDYRAVDPESGLPHLWHMACNLAFIIEKEKEAE